MLMLLLTDEDKWIVCFFNQVNDRKHLFYYTDLLLYKSLL